jgi:hypothetical protein
MKNMMMIGVVAAFAGSVIAPATVRAGDVDVGITFVDGRLASAAWDHDIGVLGDTKRVFTGELALVPGSPAIVFGDEPGFGAPGGTFASNSTLTISFRSSLRYFSGADFNAISFGSTTTRLLLENNLGSVPGETSAITSPTTDPSNPLAPDAARDFTLLVGPSHSGPEPTGGIHRHLWRTLAPQSGNAADVAEGFYLMEYGFASPLGETSETFWVIYAYGSFTEEQTELVEGWVESNLVPTPGASALMLVAGLVASRRRRA